MEDVEPGLVGQGVEHREVVGQREVAVDRLLHHLATGVARDGEEDARRARADRAVAEIQQRLRDPLQRRAHGLRVLAQLAHHARLRLADKVTAHRERAEHRLDHRHVRAQLTRDDADRLDLVVERFGVRQLDRRPCIPVRDRGPDHDRRAQAVPGRVVDGAKRLRERARARLKLDEIPTEPPGTLDGDGGQVLGRPFLAVRVAPRPDRRAVGDLHREGGFDSLPAGHQVRV